MGLYDSANEVKQEKEINPTPENPAEPAKPEGAPAPKRKGRPPGSKNKPRDGSAASDVVNKDGTLNLDLGNLPTEVIEPLALAPLLIAKMAVYHGTAIKADANGNGAKPGIVLEYDAKACIGSVAAFRKWLASIDFQLTPGWAYLGCTTVALASGMIPVIMEIKERRDAAKKETPKPSKEAMTTPPASGNPNASENAPVGNGNADTASPVTDSAP